MVTYNTGNPIGSTDSRDRLDNTENMDYLENSTTELTHADRLGTVRKTRHGMEVEHDAQIAAHEAEHDAQMQSFEGDFDGRLAGMAFTRVGSFAAGATLTDMRQVLVWEISQGGDGHEYGWAGTFPKVVVAGATPATSGGIGAGSWVDRTDDSLRDEIRETVFQNMKRLYAEAGFNLVYGSFQMGGSLSGWPDVLWDWSTGVAYQWHLDEAITVAAGSTPETAGGIGVNAWVDRTQETLKLNLASVSGSSLVGYNTGETVEDVFDRLLNAPSATGGANAIIVSYTPAYTSYSTNNVYRFLALSDNTGATTINIDGLGVKNLLGPAKLTCQGGEVVAGGYCEAVYDSSLDSIVLLSCVGGNKQVPDATQSHHAASYGQILNIGPSSAVHSGLSISYAGTVGAVSGLVTVTANGITLNTSAGLVKTLKSVSLSAIPGSASGVVNSLDTGAWAYSTCYHLYIIHNPTTSTTGLLWSLSATSPTLPSGYTYFARIGANFTQSVQYWFYKATQKGKRFQYALPRLAFSGTLGTWSTTAPTWDAVSLVSLVPTTAISTNIQITSQYNNQSVSYIAIAPNSAFKGVISTLPPPISADNVGSFSRFEVSLLLESTSIYAVSSAAGGACLIHGWEDNL